MHRCWTYAICDIRATQREIFVLLCDGCAIYILYRLSGMYICFLCDDECGYYIKKQKKYKKKQALPSVFSLTLGKATIFLFTGKLICRVQLPRHSAKFETSSSPRHVALGKDPNFAECQICSSAKFPSPVPFIPFAHSARPFTHSPVPFQLFCRVRCGTRQRFA